MEETKINFELFKQYFFKLLKDGLYAYVFYLFIWSYFWKSLRGYFNSDQTFFIVSMVLTHFSLYFGFGLFYLVLDTYGLLQQYKIKRTPVQVPSNELVKTTILENLLAQLLPQPFLLFGFFKIFSNFNYDFSFENLPSIFHFLIQVMSFSVINSFLLYWLHRFHHHSYFYSWIHKKHHEYKGTIGLAVEHAHPLEVLTSNIIPIFIAPILIQTHHAVFLSWITFRAMEGVFEHSGYEFGIITTDVDFHDYHHTVNIGNYGNGPFFDVLFGSCTHYYESKAKMNK